MSLINKTHPLRLFVYSTLREGYPNHSAFLTAGAVKMSNNARIKGYYLTTFGAQSAYGIELVKTNEDSEVSGELYALTPAGLKHVDQLFQSKMVDRACVTVRYWDIAGQTNILETAWTHIYSAPVHSVLKRYHSIFEFKFGDYKMEEKKNGTDYSHFPFIH